MSRSEGPVRETFIATKRHDLRTPINAILGYSEMLLEDAGDEGDDAGASDLEEIHAAGRALQRELPVLSSSATRYGTASLGPVPWTRDWKCAAALSIIASASSSRM